MAKRLKGPSVVNGRSGRQANGTERTPEPGTTGRFLVLVRSEAKSEGVRLLSEKVGLKLARSADFEEGAVAADVAGADGVVFDEIGVAVVKADPRQHELISAAGADSALPIVEPERIVYACETNGQPVTPVPPVLLEDFTVSLPEPRLEPLALPAAGPHAVLSIEYLEGYRDAIDGLLRRARGGGEQTARLPAAELAALTEMAATWGLQVTRVLQSRFSGRGIKLAILDTGFDLQHPDFVGRQVESQSFVPGEAVQDLNGHGTHCIGTACGPKQPAILPRYGIAYGGDIYAGKVLSNQGRGADGWILAGINWALTKRCRVVSMSLEKPVQVGEPFSQIFETTARRALARNTLIVSAAGNGSDRRFGQVRPVSHPANCPSIMSVAALDSNLNVAYFSNGGLNPAGGQVDIAAPGVNVYSTAPMPQRYRRLSGTSMATPHVAGLAALFAEANPQAGASEIWRLLVQSARRLALPATDIGVGLGQAP